MDDSFLTDNSIPSFRRSIDAMKVSDGDVDTVTKSCFRVGFASIVNTVL